MSIGWALPVPVSGTATSSPRMAAWARVMYQSFRALEQQLQQEGRTITAEAVEYPAKDVPDDPGVLDWPITWAAWMPGRPRWAGSTRRSLRSAPNTKVVLAGYSQGAMVVHRNLHALGANPNLAAALLIADGDRIPDDTTVNIGSASTDPEKTGGAAQDWPILAHTPRSCLRISVSEPSACATPATRSVTTTRMPTRCRRRPWRSTRATPPRRATGRCGPGWCTNSSGRRQRRPPR